MIALGDPELALQHKQTEQAISTLLDELGEKEKRVIRLRFGFDGEPKTLREVGEEVGNHPERVRQIEAKAIRRLKYPARSERIREACPEIPEETRYYPPPGAATRKPDPVTAWLDWLRAVKKEPRIGEVKPWEAVDFHWPYRIGMTPQEAVDLAIEVDATPDPAARERLFALTALKFCK